jgi:hypothetical protein
MPCSSLKFLTEVFDLIAAYIAGEQRLGRVAPQVTPLIAATLLLGPCFHWTFLRQALGKNQLPIKDREFATDLTATLMTGLAPRVGD